MGRFIGVDLHKNMFVACFYNPAKEEKAFKNYKLSRLSEFKHAMSTPRHVDMA